MNENAQQKSEIIVSSDRLLTTDNSHLIGRGLNLATQLTNGDRQSFFRSESILDNATELSCPINLQQFFCQEKPNILEELNKTVEVNLDYYPQNLQHKLKDSSFYVERGNLLASIGNLQDALDDYNKALEIDPNNNDAYVKRGCLRLQLGEYLNAIADFEQVLRNDL